MAGPHIRRVQIWMRCLCDVERPLDHIDQLPAIGFGFGLGLAKLTQRQAGRYPPLGAIIGFSASPASQVNRHPSYRRQDRPRALYQIGIVGDHDNLVDQFLRIVQPAPGGL